MITIGALGIRTRSFAQVAHYPPGASYGPRTLRDYELVWLLSGSARWRVSEAGASGAVHDIELHPGVLVLARPGMTDLYRWDDRRASSHAYVHFEVDAPVPSGVASLMPFTRPFAGHDPLRALCGYLLDLASVAGDDERARTDQVVGLLFDLFLNGPFPQVNAEEQIPPRLRPAIDHVRRAWETQAVRPVRVPELAAAAGSSRAHFSRTFAAAFGCGPAAALELVRLGRAAIALQRSNLSIAEIARLHGFADAYHFSKRFGAAYGVPPGRFRRGDGEDVDPLGPLAARGLLPLWAHLSAETAANPTER